MYLLIYSSIEKEFIQETCKHVWTLSFLEAKANETQEIHKDAERQ